MGAFCNPFNLHGVCDVGSKKVGSPGMHSVAPEKQTNKKQRTIKK